MTEVGTMLFVLGSILVFVIMFLAMWDQRSEFLWPTIYVTGFCLVVGFLIERYT